MARLRCRSCGSDDIEIEDVGLTITENIATCNNCNSKEVEEVD